MIIPDKDTSKVETVKIKRRKCDKESSSLSERGRHTLRFFIEDYDTVAQEAILFRSTLDSLYERHPELFPDDFSLGYCLHDIRRSKKYKDLIIRRIKLRNKQVYSIVPSAYMPYLTAKTDDVEKALLLRHWALPYDVTTYAFGKNDSYWEGLEMSLGQMSIVGSLCKAVPVPEDLAADEKISFWNKEECYIAMTASQDCVLGAEISMGEDTIQLQAAYGVFQAEAQDVAPNYKANSVNLDGWKATNAAWRNLFPSIDIVACFLHGFLKVRDISKQLKNQFNEICTKIWDAYRQETSNSFKQSLIELKEWASLSIDNERVKVKIIELCDKSERYVVAYEQPTAYRTSNQIDRPMNHLDRYLYQARYFNGHRKTANLKVRAWAMIYNFMPFSNRTICNKGTNAPKSRFEQLNGFAYHQNWLHNLLIASSMNGFKQLHKKR